MHISTIHGVVIVGTVEEVRAQVQRREANQFGAFWLDHSEFPALMLAFNGELAWANYIPGDEEAGFLSQGDYPDGADDIAFLDLDGQQDLRPAYCVIPAALAEQAAVEFFKTADRPPNIHWIAL